VPQIDRAEYFYNQFKMHLVFGVLSVGLIGVTLAIIYADWNREWKQYQAEFRDMQIDRTRQRLEEATTASVDRVADLEKKLAAAQKELEANADEYAAAKERVRVGKANTVSTRMSMQAKRAEADEARYEYELLKSEHRGPDTPRHLLRLAEYRARFEREFAEANRLRDIYNKAELDFEAANKALGEMTAAVNAIQKELVVATSETGRLQRQLNGMRKNLFNDAFRNLPLVDFIAPSFRIQQTLINDIKDDIHFAHVGKVDRCQTCHVAIDKPGFEDAPQPLTTHPDLEMYVSDASPHASKLMGCTVCHEGNGMSTEFGRAAHTPRDYEQQKEWEAKYHWHKQHHWERPMLPKGLEQTSCNKCHTQPEQIPTAEVLLHGHTLFLQKGCYACHSIEKPAYQKQKNPGPTLRHVTEKLTPGWVNRWVADPWHFRPDTAMPRLFHLENNTDPLSTAQDNVMVEAATRYLFAKATPIDMPTPPNTGDVAAGEELFKVVGCMACHVVDGVNEEAQAAAGDQYQVSNFGPNLSKIGAKTNHRWLYGWLKEPKHYWPDTAMPSLRLEDQEATDIAAYLMTLQGEAVEEAPLPSLDPDVIDGLIVLDMATKMPEKDIRTMLASMSENDKLLLLGEKSINQKQCYSCHEINGFEGANPIILSFTDAGAKDLDRLFFGHISNYPSTEMVAAAKEKKEPVNSWHHYLHSLADSTVNTPYSQRGEVQGSATLRFPDQYGNAFVPYPTDADNATVAVEDTFVPKDRLAYYFNQIKNPQLWDRGINKNWWEKQRMGQFGLSDAESHALALFVASQRQIPVAAKLKDKITPNGQALVEGRQVIKQFNCQACHTIGLYEDILNISPKDPADIYAGGISEVDLGKTRLWTSRAIMGKIPLFNDKEEQIGTDIREVLGKNRWLVGDIFDKEYGDFLPAADFLMGYDVRRVPVFGKHEGWVRQHYASLPVAPPVLYEQGRKTRPEWLFQWLKQVHTLRPHIKVRMPQYDFTDAEVGAIVHYFAAHDGEPWPFQPEERLAENLDMVAIGHQVYLETVKCNLCHPAGDSMPTNSNQSAWAPNLALAQQRLKVDWVKRWLRNPQAIYPGTLMPNNFYLDEGEKLTPTLGPAEKMEEYVSGLASWFQSLDVRVARTVYPNLIAFEKERAAAAAKQDAEDAEGTAAPATDGTTAPAKPAKTDEDNPYAAAPATVPGTAPTHVEKEKVVGLAQ